MGQSLPLDSKGQSSKREESSAKQLEDYERKIFEEIARRLSPEECQSLGLRLGLETNELKSLEKECNLHHYGEEFKILLMLEKWKGKTNPHEDLLVPLLVKALKDIKRNDIAGTIQKIRSHRNPESLLELQKEMQNTLRNRFKDFMLPRSLWLKKKWLPLEELYVELTMIRKNRRGEEMKENIEIEKIFEETEKKITRRILIEGHPGYGKTTLVTKFLSDWAKVENYISDRFDLVFVIALRNYEGDLSRHLLQQCERVNGRAEEKLRAIEANEGKVLLLLDGFDETPTKFKEDLLGLFNRELYPQMTVIITCRTGSFQLETKSDKTFDCLGNKGFENHFVWDKRVKIQGISPDKRKEFLKKYLNVNDEILREQFSQSNLKLNDLYECPLFLLLLAVLIQEKDMRQIRTKTEFYKTIFNFVINRGLEKLKGKIEEFDVFDSKPELDKFGCRDLLINFGRLCLEKIKHQTLIFEESELLNCSCENGDEDLILKLGILTKQISFFRNEEKEHYEPTHRTFLEFSAAFFLSTVDEMEREIQELVLKFNIRPKEDQLLYPFLGGFLQSNAFKLFKALDRVSGLISIFNHWKYYYNVESILLEIPRTEEILKSLENFSMDSLNESSFKEKKFLHEWFLSLLKNSEKMSNSVSLKIPEDIDIITGLTDDIKINIIEARIEDSLFNAIKINRSHIQCRNLLIIFCNGFNKACTQDLNEVLSKVKAEKIWLKVSYFPLFDVWPFFIIKFYIGKFYEALVKDFHHFYHLIWTSITPSMFSIVSPYIKELIKQNQIDYGIRIDFSEGATNDSFRKEFISFQEVVSNSHLKSFDVRNSPLNDVGFVLNPLPFPNVFFDDEKQMQFFRLEGLFEGMNENELKCSTEFFDCSGFYYIPPKKHRKDFSFSTFIDKILTKLILKCHNVETLSCHSNLVSLLSVCNWKGFETVQRLKLNHSCGRSTESFLKGISFFRNVREIRLLHWEHNYLLIKIITLLPSLKKIHYSLEDNYLIEFLEKLLAFKSENADGKSLHFEELEVIHYYFRENSDLMSSVDFMKCLEKCFLQKIFLKFLFLDPKVSRLENLLLYFISKKNVKISSQWILVTAADNSIYSDTFFETVALKQELSICYDNLEKNT